MRHYVQTVRNFNVVTLRYLIATALLGFAIDGGVYAVIFNLYLLRLGFGPEAIGQINFAGLLTFAICSLPAGALGARYGARRVMATGVAVLACGSLLLPLAELVPLQFLFVQLLVSYVMLFLGLALYFANAAPFLMEITSHSERNHAFSVQSALLAFAAFLGSLLGGYLPRLFSFITGVAPESAQPYRFPLVVAALLMLVATWVVWRMPDDVGIRDESSDEGSTAVASATRRQIVLPIVALIAVLSLIRLLQVAGIGTVATYFNVYLDLGLQESTSRIGVLSALARIVAVPSALFTPWLIGRWGAPRTVVISSAASSLFILPLALIPNWQAAGLGYIGVVAFSSLRYPAFIAYSLDLVPVRWRGTLSGAGETAGGMSFAAMALAGGYLIGNQGYEALFWASAVLTMLGTVMFWFYFRTEIKPVRRPGRASSIS